MQRLFLFLFKYIAFIFFLFLEGVSFFFIVNYNTYQQAVFLNSSNTIVGGLLGAKTSVTSYFTLSEKNEELLEENRRLKEQLLSLSLDSPEVDTIEIISSDTTFLQYYFIKSEIVNNTINLKTNYLTIRGGRKAGFKRGDAVINDMGIVGKVTSVSQNYATAISLLHVNNHISTEIKRTKTICSTKWDGIDFRKSKVLYVPRHVEVLRGDTIVTSGYNAIFPAGLNVGVIDKVTLSPDASFYEIGIDLSVDFNNLDYVYGIGNMLNQEQDSLESVTIEDIQS